MLPTILTHVRGSIFMMQFPESLLKSQKYYTDLELIFSLSQVETASGEYLDSKASEYGITRHGAEKARYTAAIMGTVTEEK